MSLCLLSAYTLSFPSLHVSPSLFLTRVPPPPLSRVPAGNSICTPTSSPPYLRPCSTASRTFSKEGRGRDIIHTHTLACTRASSLCMPLGVQALASCVRACRYAALLPRASSLNRVLPPPLSRVSHRFLWLNNNQVTTLPETVFNGLTNRK